MEDALRVALLYRQATGLLQATLLGLRPMLQWHAVAVAGEQAAIKYEAEALIIILRIDNVITTKSGCRAVKVGWQERTSSKS